MQRMTSLSQLQNSEKGTLEKIKEEEEDQERHTKKRYSIKKVGLKGY